MLVPVAVLSVLLGLSLSCELSSYPEDQHPLAQRLCQLENEMRVMERVMQEVLQRADLTVYPEVENLAIAPEKRKNEFIRFGKRSEGETDKRKNEFIRFGKRKNEFIRFGRSLPSEAEMEKRKNEFIRFG